MDKSEFDKEVEGYTEKEIFEKLADIHNVSFEVSKSEKKAELEDDDLNVPGNMKAPWEDDE